MEQDGRGGPEPRINRQCPQDFLPINTFWPCPDEERFGKKLKEVLTDPAQGSRVCDHYKGDWKGFRAESG